MGRICIFTGSGHGKSPAAIGEAVMRASNGDHVVIIQYLKGKGVSNTDFLNRLEPELKIFHFEKSDEVFEELSKAKQEEEIINIKNGINFARKVISTGECDLLVLDEILGIVDNGILSVDELKDMLSLMSENMDVIMTGINADESILKMADCVSRIS